MANPHRLMGRFPLLVPSALLVILAREKQSTGCRKTLKKRQACGKVEKNVIAQGKGEKLLIRTF